MKQIILDTNFILDCIKYKIDIKSEIAKIIDENFTLSIFNITKREISGKKDERLALQILKKINPDILETDSDNVDRAILSLNKKNIIVATHDRKLKEKLKKAFIPVITIREKQYLRLI